jgi:hypothetical protein
MHTNNKNLQNMFADKRVIVINNNIYDVTSFLNEHPGGRDILEEYIYTDATIAFNDVGHSESAKVLLSKYIVDSIDINNIHNNVFKNTKENNNKLINQLSYQQNNDVDMDFRDTYNYKNESCSGLSHDCKQIKNRLNNLMAIFFGSLSLLILYVCIICE